MVWDESFRGIVHDEDARLLRTHDPTSLYVSLPHTLIHTHTLLLLFLPLLLGVSYLLVFYEVRKQSR